MPKTMLSARIQDDLFDALESISTESQNKTYHVERALTEYSPIKKALKPRKVELEIPGDINLDAWNEWAEFRRSEKKKTITKSAAKKQFKLLLNYSHEQQQLVIDNSIQNDYQGLFALKGVNNNEINNRPNQQSKLSVVERVRQAADERQRARQAKYDNGSPMGETIGSLRPSASQPVRSDDTGELGEVIDGDYTRAD